jgi:hypothetical protein
MFDVIGRRHAGAAVAPVAIVSTCRYSAAIGGVSDAGKHHLGSPPEKGTPMSTLFRRCTALVVTLGVFALLAAQPSQAATAYGVTGAGQLIRFDTAAPGTINASVPITGLAGAESVVAIDFRPLTGQLYGLGSGGGVYTINTLTGGATAAGTPLAISGTIGLDFNPTVDRLRLVSDANTNLRFNPVTAALAATDTNLAYIATDANAGADPNIVAVAYDRNDLDAATPTTLFAIDSNLNILVRQGAADGSAADAAGGGSPNGGLLTTIGSLGVDVTGAAGFDILTQSGNVNTAYAALSNNGTSSGLYRINLSTGAATLVGGIGGAPTLVGALAIVDDDNDVVGVPAVSSLGLLVLALTLCGLAWRGIRRVA